VRYVQHHFLTLLGQLPARLTADQTARVLNFQAHDVPVPIAAELLKVPGSRLERAEPASSSQSSPGLRSRIPRQRSRAVAEWKGLENRQYV
jgi:hypothetical protein